MRSRSSFAPARRRRSPLGLILIAFLVALLGLLIWLSMRDSSVPQQRVEQDVTNEVLK